MFIGESDNDEHFVIETAQSDSDSECNLSDNELEIVPEQSEDLEHDAELSGLTKKSILRGHSARSRGYAGFYTGALGTCAGRNLSCPRGRGSYPCSSADIPWEIRIQHFGAFEKIDLGLYIGLLPGSHHTRLPQPSVEGGTSTTSRNEENDDHGVLAVRSPASLARTAYYEYLRILKNALPIFLQVKAHLLKCSIEWMELLKSPTKTAELTPGYSQLILKEKQTQKRNIVLVENSNHLDLGDVSVYPDTRGILVVRVYLEKRKSKMELPENVNVAIKFEVTEPKSECVIPSIKEENEMNCNSTKYVNEVVKSEVPDIFEPFSQYDLPLIKEELETELPENIKPEETKPKFVCGIPLIKEENEVNLNSTKYVDGVVKSEGDIFEPFSQCNVPFIKEELEENISGYKRNLRSSEFKTSWRHSSVSRVLEQPGGSGGRNTVMSTDRKGVGGGEVKEARERVREKERSEEKKKVLSQPRKMEEEKKREETKEVEMREEREDEIPLAALNKIEEVEEFIRSKYGKDGRLNKGDLGEILGKVRLLILESEFCEKAAQEYQTTTTTKPKRRMKETTDETTMSKPKWKTEANIETETILHYLRRGGETDVSTIVTTT
uniref:Uncharacterized protein n=1 Tax=Timema douglasi TaxID=61478 RepID=A0A7R8VIP4_TIMDO|nr:unnamed protein product [Timema douglasi]